MMNHRHHQQHHSNQFSDSDGVNDDDLSDNSGNSDQEGWQEEAMRSGELFHYRENPQSHEHKAVRNEHMKVISVQVDAQQGAAQGQDLLANLLGIISIKSRARPNNSPGRGDHIHVDALVPGGAAYKCGYVALGDVLVSVDDLPVVASNINQTLALQTSSKQRRGGAGAAHRLKLAFRSRIDDRVPPLLSGEHYDVTGQQGGQAISEVRMSSPGEEITLPGLLKPHGVFYLDLNMSSEASGAGGDDARDVLYRFPGDETRLVAARGILITVNDLVRENFRDRVAVSTMRVGGETTHCAYRRERDDGLLVVAAPGDLYTRTECYELMLDACELCTVMFGSLHEAFHSGQHRLRLDHLFQYMFVLNSLPPSVGGHPWQHRGVHKVSLPADLDMQLNGSLAEFESNDMLTALDGFNPSGRFRRRFTVVTSALFYGGLLVANHMSDDDIGKVRLFCFNHGLLTSQKHQIGLLVIWREVHSAAGSTPARRPLGKKAPFKCGATRRRFWLIVGLNNAILCSTVEMNRGVFPADHVPRPDPVLVNTAHAILMQLEATLNDVTRSMASEQAPLAGADAFVSPPQNQLLSVMTSPFKFPFTSQLSVTSQKSGGGDDVTSSKAMTSSGTIFRRSSSQNSQHAGDTKRGRSLFRESSHGSADSFVTSSNDAEAGYRYMTFADDVNRLLCYVTSDAGSLQFEAPTSGELADTTGVLHEKIISNFRRCARVLRHRLGGGGVTSSHKCVEEGMSFRLKVDAKKSVDWWVVGRLVGGSREMFVCYHQDSVLEENVVEIAFRLLAHR